MFSKKIRRINSSIFILIITIGLIIINLGPIFWAISTSLKPPREILLYPPSLIGSRISFEHYVRVLEGGIMHSLYNTIIFSLSAIVSCIVLGVLAGYSLSRFRFPGKKLITYIIIGGIPMAIARAPLLVPAYVFLSALGLVDRVFTLPLLYTIYSLPMAIWILRGFFETIPREIDDAAKIDGCSRLIILTKIMLPLIRPGIAAVSIFTFVLAWNEFIVAAIMVSRPELLPIQVAVYNYLGYYGREWGPLTAASLMSILPVLVLFIFLQRQFIAGLTGGSIKG